MAHHSSTLDKAGRSMMGLLAGWRRAKHAGGIVRRGSKCPLKVSAVRRHPLWTATHVDALVSDIIQSMCGFYILTLSL